MYVNATQEPWNKHYQMYTYITEELYELIQNHFPVIKDKISITGHRLFIKIVYIIILHSILNYLLFFYSMGGHGALLCALRNPEKYKSVSLFAPACNISNSPTLLPGFTTLIGDVIEDMQKWDPTYLVKNYDGPELEILIHVVCILLSILIKLVLIETQMLFHLFLCRKYIYLKNLNEK